MKTQNVQRKPVSRACGYWGDRDAERFLRCRVLCKTIQDFVNETVSGNDDQCVKSEFYVLCDFDSMASSCSDYGRYQQAKP